MPLIKLQAVNENIHLAVWKITEDIAELHEKIKLSEKDKLVYSKIKHRGKALEFLAGRKLCVEAFQHLGFQYLPIFRNEYGKPELPHSKYYISLSHTADFVVLAIGKAIEMGVDIEKPNEKMRKIASRLFNNAELAFCNEELSHFSKVWSAKEVLYKIYMKREIDFKEHLFVRPIDKEWTQMQGEIIKDTYQKNVILNFIKLDEYYICFNID
jgi:4'-phosphopantetheinyl transferase EntD